MTDTQPTPEQAAPTNVVAALARVMSDLPGIGRTETSEQGYSYRGIENITRHAQHLLGKYGVVFVPRVVNRTVKDFTINNRPWTEDCAEVVYTVYGPGGLDDKIEVGPLVGLGRDNSDKGMNKSMTQAFKYALIQTLCIGDAKDDPDHEVAHEADAREGQVSGERAARIELSSRIRGLSVEGREKVRAFCDEHSIPRVTAQMDDDQLELVTEHVDGLAPADATNAGEAPSGPETAPDADPAAEALPLDATLEKVIQGEAGFTEKERAAIAAVKAMPVAEVDRELMRLREPTTGTAQERRGRLATVYIATRA